MTFSPCTIAVMYSLSLQEWWLSHLLTLCQISLKSSTGVTLVFVSWTTAISSRTPSFDSPFQGTSISSPASPFHLCWLPPSQTWKSFHRKLIFQGWWLYHPTAHFSVLKSTSSIIKASNSLLFYFFGLLVDENIFQLVDCIHSYYVNAISDVYDHHYFYFLTCSTYS